MTLAIVDGLSKVGSDLQKLVGRYVIARHDGVTCKGLLYKVEKDLETTIEGLVRC
jgi:hypothetical protein